jgi:hypothetical protein
MLRIRGAYALRFFAGFCLVANGLYIGLGSFNHVGDCGEMLRHGSQPWQLWIFGLLAAASGLWLWHAINVRIAISAVCSTLALSLLVDVR